MVQHETYSVSVTLTKLDCSMSQRSRFQLASKPSSFADQQNLPQQQGSLDASAESFFSIGSTSPSSTLVSSARGPQAVFPSPTPSSSIYDSGDIAFDHNNQEPFVGFYYPTGGYQIEELTELSNYVPGMEVELKTDDGINPSGNMDFA